MATEAPTVRVLLANLPGVIGQVLAAQIKEAQDMFVVNQVEGQIEVLIAARKGVDVVILGVPHLLPPPGLVSHLLNEFPNIKVLVFSVRTSDALGYWLGVRRCRVNEMTPDRVLTSIRMLSTMTPSL